MASRQCACANRPNVRMHCPTLTYHNANTCSPGGVHVRRPCKGRRRKKRSTASLAGAGAGLPTASAATWNDSSRPRRLLHHLRPFHATPHPSHPVMRHAAPATVLGLMNQTPTTSRQRKRRTDAVDDGCSIAPTLPQSLRDSVHVAFGSGSKKQSDALFFSAPRRGSLKHVKNGTPKGSVLRGWCGFDFAYCTSS